MLCLLPCPGRPLRGASNAVSHSQPANTPQQAAARACASAAAVLRVGFSETVPVPDLAQQVQDRAHVEESARVREFAWGTTKAVSAAPDGWGCDAQRRQDYEVHLVEQPLQMDDGSRADLQASTQALGLQLSVLKGFFQLSDQRKPILSGQQAMRSKRSSPHATTICNQPHTSHNAKVPALATCSTQSGTSLLPFGSHCHAQHPGPPAEPAHILLA